MKKYCLQLMEIPLYDRKTVFSSPILQDIKVFANQIQVKLNVMGSHIRIGENQISIQDLSKPLGKQRVFNWLMGMCNE